MNCRILHEIDGRMRVHICQPSMTMEEADLLQTYLGGISGVTDAKVSELTANAVIRYRPSSRQEVLHALASFDYETADTVLPEHSGRAMQREYMNRMTVKILRRACLRLFVPAGIRKVITAAKSVPYLYRGICCLLQGKLRVEVLDAASILTCILRREYNSAGQIMFLLGIGDLMEEWTHRKSVNDLADAMSLHVDKVWLRTDDGSEVLCGIDQIRCGDIICVRSGNVIPLDGEACAGEAMVNQSSLTGEPLSVRKTAGSYLYAGTVVEEGDLEITVRNTNGSGRYDRIISMIEESEKLKSEAETNASRLADRLVPWTFAAAGLTWLITRDANRAASILNVDFCCALKLSMPIAVLSAMREAGTHSISVKGGKFMELVAEADTVVFDKTGTLTSAQPSVKAVIPFNGNDENEILRLAACLEEHYPHSVANAIVRAAKIRNLEHEEMHSSVSYVVAHGIVSTVNGERVCIGSGHFIFEDEGCTVLENEQLKLQELPDEYSHLYLAVGGILSAVILIEDPVRENAADVIRGLHDLGFDSLVMMTGDSRRTAASVAKQIGVDDFRAEVLPEDKAAYIRSCRTGGHKVIMVGDGVNDSPALSEADVGIAVSSGAAIAREIADITVTQDDLSSLVTLRHLSEGLMRRIRRNYTDIILFNSAFIALGAAGILSPAATALLHNTSTIAISLRSTADLLPQRQA